jgi:hypothetical protein
LHEFLFSLIYDSTRSFNSNIFNENVNNINHINRENMGFMELPVDMTT